MALKHAIIRENELGQREGAREVVLERSLNADILATAAQMLPTVVVTRGRALQILADVLAHVEQSIKDETVRL